MKRAYTVHCQLRLVKCPIRDNQSFCSVAAVLIPYLFSTHYSPDSLTKSLHTILCPLPVYYKGYGVTLDQIIKISYATCETLLLKGSQK